MENYLVFIMCVALAGALLDSLAERHVVLQRQFYRLFFALIWFLFLIRLYYGQDILSYVPHYEDIASPSFLLAHPEQMTFEFGYELLCSVLHAMGASFWWLTAVITTLYFAALACFFHSLERHRLFAFAALILLDYNLIYAQTRECMAVSFFIFMILCLRDKRYVLALLTGILTVLCHKSGLIAVGVTLLGIPLWHMRQSADGYKILLVLMIVILLIPVSRAGASLLTLLPLPEDYIDSIQHHMLLGRQFQIVAVVYLAVLFLLICWHRPQEKNRYGWIAIECLLGMAVIVCFYQYFNLLMRMRSFFLPMIIGYVTALVTDPERIRKVPYGMFLRQAVAVWMMVYFVHTTLSFDRMTKQWHAPVVKASTLFDLRHHSERDIRNRQMKYAETFWNEDYMRDKKYEIK